MPTLPSGRRIEFSLDRFHALLQRMDRPQACALAMTLETPDDLLFVMDTVHFAREDGAPFFAGCVASDWKSYAAEWSTGDRQALLTWFASDEARLSRAEAIEYVRSLWLGHPGNGAATYPYVVLAGTDRAKTAEGSRLLQ